MLFHETKPEYYLVQTSDLNAAVQSPQLRNVHELFQITFEWLDKVIAAPHPQLGRTGDVCPFVRNAMERDLIWVTVYKGPYDLAGLIDYFMPFLDWYKTLAPLDDPDAESKVVVVMLPEIAPAELPNVVAELRNKIKPWFLVEQVSTSTFYKGRDDYSSLLNPAFHPLQSPVPMFVFRNFSRWELNALRSKDAFLSWLSIFQDRIPKRSQARANELIEQYQITLPVTKADFQIG